MIPRNSGSGLDWPMRNPSSAQSVLMPAPHRSQRTRSINLDVMKSQIVKKLGPDRAKGYFGSLSRLLGLKMTKDDFNKFCLLKFGRDFVPLHNKFVRLILHNACNAMVPPPRAAAKEKGNVVVLSASTCKSAVANEKVANLPLQESSCNSVQQPVMSNGNVPSASPCKTTSGGRDGRNDDRPSPLQINGKKTDGAPHQSSAAEGETVSRENGFFRPCDLKRSQEPQQNVLAEPLAKRPRTGVTTALDNVPVQSKLFELARGWTGDTTTFGSSPDLRSVQQNQNGPAEPSAKRLSTGERLVQDYVPVNSKLAALPGEVTRDKTGINYSPFDIRGSMLLQQQKQNGSAEPATRLCTGDVAAHAENSVPQQNQDGPAEPPASVKGHVSMHTSPIEVPAAVDEEVAGDKTIFDARRRPIRAPFGISFSDGSVGGAFVSPNMAGSTGSFSGCYDSGELLYTDAVRNRMKRIVEAQGMEEVTMASANTLRQGLDCYLKRLISACVLRQEVIKLQPYAKPVNGVLPGSLEVENELTRQRPVSLLDFKVAMEIHPRQLGNDWPRLLEKICFRAFEE